MSIEIALAQDDVTRARLYHFRYQIHTMEMHKDGYDVDHQHQWIFDMADHQAYQIYAKKDDEILGCIRVNINESGEFPQLIRQLYKTNPLEKKLQAGQIAVTGRFVIDPKYRNQTLASLLMSRVYEFLVERHALVNYSLCHIPLVQSYHRLGYRRYQKSNRQNGRESFAPLLMCLRDKKHLNQVMSPFADILNPDYDDCGQAAQVIQKTYRGFQKQVNVSPCDVSTFWAELADVYARGLATRPSLFDRLHQNEIHQILTSSKHFHLNQGDPLIFPEEKNIGVGVVLQGKLGDGYQKPNGHHHWFELFKEGDTFGEPEVSKKFGRQSELVALEPTEVIILASNLLEQLKHRDPILATRLTMNMIAFMQQRISQLEAHRQEQKENNIITL